MPPCLAASCCSSAASRRSSSASRPKRSSAARFEVVGALGLIGFEADPLDLLAQRLHLLQRLTLGLPLGPHRICLGAQIGKLLAQLFQALLAGLVLLFGQRRLLDLETSHPSCQLVELGRHRVDLGAQHRAGFIDEIDRLVRQESIRDVAMAQHNRGDEGGVLDLHAVEHLEPLAQTPQDGDGVLHRRLVDDNRLEAPLQGRVLLNVLAVLVEGCRTDHVQLAAGEHRLEHVAGIHRSLGGAGADHGVQLVDEQQDPAFGASDLVEHGLQTLLELAAVLGAGHQRAHVEGEDRPVTEPFGHVAVDDALGETFDDRRLADSGIADQNGVVLRLARQDLHHAPDLAVAPDDGVELAGPRLVDEVAPVLLQRLVGHLRHRRGHPLVAADLRQHLEEVVASEPVRCEQAAGCCRGTLGEEREHEMLDRHVLVLQTLGLALGRIEEAAEALSEEHLTGGRARARHAGSSRQFGFELCQHSVGVDPDLCHQPASQTVGLLDQGEQKVLAVDLGVAEAQRLGLGVVQRLLRLLGEAVHVHCRAPVETVVDGCRRCAASNRAIRSRRSTTRPRAA